MKRTPKTPGPLALFLSEQERLFLLDALQRHSGHNSNTARWLGLSRRSLYIKLTEHGLEGEAAALRTEAGIMGPRGRTRRHEPEAPAAREDEVAQVLEHGTHEAHAASP